MGHRASFDFVDGSQSFFGLPSKPSTCETSVLSPLDVLMGLAELIASRFCNDFVMCLRLEEVVVRSCQESRENVFCKCYKGESRSL